MPLIVKRSSVQHMIFACWPKSPISSDPWDTCSARSLTIREDICVCHMPGSVMSGSSFGWFVWGPFLCKLQSVLIFPLRLLHFALVSCLIKPLFFYDVFYILS